MSLMECALLPGNALHFDVSTRIISAGVSPIGSQILIEWSVPDITKVRSLGLSHVLVAAALITAFSLSTG